SNRENAPAGAGNEMIWHPGELGLEINVLLVTAAVEVPVAVLDELDQLARGRIGIDAVLSRMRGHERQHSFHQLLIETQHPIEFFHYCKWRVLWAPFSSRGKVLGCLGAVWPLGVVAVAEVDDGVHQRGHPVGCHLETREQCAQQSLACEIQIDLAALVMNLSEQVVFAAAASLLALHPIADGLIGAGTA